MDIREIRNVARLVLFAVGFAAALWVIDSINLIPAALATASPDKLGAEIDGQTTLSASGQTINGVIKFGLATAAGAFLMFSYAKPLTVLISGFTGVKAVTKTAKATARDKLSRLQERMPPDQRAIFESILVQAAYEKDPVSLGRAAHKLAGENFLSKKPTPKAGK